jgi:cytochrome c-type biogenesis protein CcmE
METNMQLNSSNLIAATAATLALLTSCGGGGGTQLVVPPSGGGPAAGTADLTVQLTQGSRGASAVGDSMAGVLVQLIDAASGALLGSGTTNAGGRFEVKALPSGDTLLVKVEFTSNSDLDGDRLNDQIELTFPLSLADQSATQLLKQIGLTDSNSDGQLDSVDVAIEVGDDNGRSESHRRQHRHRDGRTVEDSNGNGNIDSSDRSFDDSDCDGLPDGSGRFNERELVGTIEALSADSITVGGVTFTISSGTEWQVGRNHHSSPSLFSVGQIVKIEGFMSAQGVLVAREVKDTAAFNGDDDGFGGGDNDGRIERELIGSIEALSAESITVSGVTFTVSSFTEWQVGDDHHAAPSSFSVGQTVKIEGFLDAQGNLTAHEVKDQATFAGRGGDDDDDDDNGGDRDDDDDDNSGRGGDDDDDDDGGRGRGGDDD